MKKKTLILIAALCLVVLGITLWMVFSGVDSVLPNPVDPSTEDNQEVQQGGLQNPQQEEHFPMVDESGMPIEGDNVISDPWGDVEQAPAPNNTPAKAPQETITSDGDLALTDEGWSDIY